MIKTITISNLRNITHSQYDLHPQLNLITGDNGAGKTSILEAIYMLSSGHSFRTRETQVLINHQQESVTVFCRLLSGDSIGLEKNRQAKTRVKLNSAFCRSSSQLAEILPVQVIYQDIFQIIDAGPTHRRHIIDWGLFHVKHDYFPLWSNYNRVLKQRNSLLRRKASRDEIKIWDSSLASYGKAITEMRLEYLSKLKSQFNTVLSQLTNIDCQIEFYQGWDKKGLGISLEQCFQQSLEKDFLRQYTQYGPHQADIIIQLDEKKAKNIVSRGQQKLILIALKLAQLQLLNKPTVVLMDDYSAELDNTSRQRLADVLLQLNSQLIITAIEPSNLTAFDNTPHKKFHVEH